ncbi:MAG: hypothetical protein ACXAC8_16790 [Candidatus Hodarchaeales archaeon]
MNYIEVTENVITTAIITEESNNLTRSYLTSNMSCINLPEGLVFIDSGSRVDLARKFRESMEEKYEKEATHLIITSNIWDKFFGMKAFEDTNILSSTAAKTGIRLNLKKGVISSTVDRILLNITEDEGLRDNLDTLEVFPPTSGFSDEHILGKQPNHLDLKHLYGGTISVFAVPERVLFTSIAFMTSRVPFIWRTDIIDIYEMWEHYEFDFVVPGNGSVVNRSYLSTVREWHEEIFRKLHYYRDIGIEEQQILNQEFPIHPHSKRESWIEGNRVFSGAVDSSIRMWYKRILKAQRQKEELNFIS